MMKKLIVAGAVLVSVLAYGDNPPPPPGPEGWAFRRELAEDPPPDYAAPIGKPWLENRISRCFFSPIKRPPFNRDELKDDIDYYPDNYLERLRREGVNGLWLSLALRDMDEASLAKLGRTVAKCAAHGIKVWAFCIEPRNRPHDDPFYLAHPDARGAKTWDGNYVNCPSSPAVLGEIEELVARIFRAVPGLAGMINIANGERATTCLSFAPARVDRPKIPCAKCSKREPWELYAEVANAMVRGMRKGNPEARLISWFYQPEPSPTRGSWVYECARHAPEGVEFQFNFESGAVREQVGKTRTGGDYWLSVPGPAAPFERVAAVSREVGKPLSAKIQTSCSHECATVPYVPVPGLLYRKFRGMRDAGVRDVMMCWYFGNAPGLMNRAAGLLAYEDFKDGEDAFLERLAKDEWGEDAAVMGGLWRKFSDAYSNYPLSNDIQYYGPFHAGFSWPLYPSVSMRSLQRTWKPLETPGGDLIGECLADFSLEDAFACADRMVRELDGVRPTLARLRTKYASDRSRRRDLGIMVTLMDLFESGRDIFRFYIVRRDGVFASRTDGDNARALACVAEMKDIIARERGRSEEMIPLCADDSRLGFHSEAQAHQFTADYLRWRIGELAKADAELQAIEHDLKAGKAWPESERECTAKVIRAEELADGSLVFEGECPELAEGLGMELRTYDLCGTAPARVYEVKPSKGRYRLVVAPSDWGNDPKQRPAWVVIRQGHDYNNGGTTWAHPDLPMFPEPRLHQDALTGDNFARVRLVRGRGALVLTFDDPRYDDWIRQIPLFERYGAHATFFPCGHIGTNEVAKLKRLAAAGHSIGIHTEHHRDADRAFSEEGAHMFMRDEINPQLKACTDAGLEIRYLAYPNNRHTPETDGYLAGAFRRFRAGVKGMTGYHTNGTSIVTLDRAFFPVADLPKHRVMEGTGVGAYYSTDIDDLCRGIRRAAERDEVLVLFSHDISENPGRVGMRTEWLEKLLATAKDCGVAVKGFDELGPVDPQVPQGPMRLYLTFDDGVKEHLFAAEELEKRGWRGIFCIVTDWIGKEGKLTWDDVRELHRRGHVIANHTKTHRGLGNLWKQGLPDEVRKEILGGADAIERETGTRPKLLCLPGTSGHKEVTKTAAELGETTMLVPRHCFGDWPHTSGDVIDRLRANGQSRADFLVHGVSAAGGGWRPFATREDFIRYLDGIKAAEDAGKVAVTADYTLKPQVAAVTMMNVAHRGLWVEAKVPQNTVEAIKAAYDAGAQVVETDFNETACGEMICLHDKKALLTMVTGFDKEVKDLTPEDRATINLGEKAKLPRAYRIPTLDEVLAVVPKDRVLQSEIKLYGPGYADKFDAAVKRAGLTEKNITVSSFDLAALKDFHAKYPKYETIYLLNMRPQFDASLMISRCRSADVDVMCPSCAGCRNCGFTPEEAEKVRQAGIEFRVFGVNDPECLRYAMSLGATGFTCNTFKKAYEWAKDIPGLTLLPEHQDHPAAVPGARPLALVGPESETQAVISDITNRERIRVETFGKALPDDCTRYAAVIFCGKVPKGVDPAAVPAGVKVLRLEGVSAKRLEFFRAGKPLAEADERGESILTDAGRIIRDMTEDQRRRILALPGLDRTLPKGEYDTVPLGAKGALPAYPTELSVKPVFRDAPPARGEGLVLKDGAKQAVIVAAKEHLLLAHELAWHLERMCGAKFAVKRAAEATDLAPVVEFKTTGGALGRSEIRREGNRLVIGGESSGIGYALTYVLEALGCRYLWPGELGKVIPKKDRIVLPDIALDYVPEFKIRYIRDEVPKMKDELVRLGIDAEAFGRHFRAVNRDAPGNREFMAWHGVNDGRNVKGSYAWGHYFGDYWDRFGKEHPEWFALQANGSREQHLGDRKERPTLCLSNRALAEQGAKDILADFARSPALYAHSICLPDGGYMGQCMCEACRRLDPVNAPSVPNHTCSPLWRSFPYVSLTDRVMTFNNRIAEAVTAAMPDRKLTCYIYSYYEKPPVAVKPHPALVLLSVAGNYSGPDRGAVQRNIAAWSTFGNELLWRPNALIHSRVNLPKNFARPFFEDLEALKVNNVIGTDISGFGRQWANKGFVYYMVAKAHRNPDRLSYDALAADYFRAGFGSAAADVAAYFAALEELGDACAAAGRSANGYVEAFDVERFAALLAKAKVSAAGDATVLARIDFLARGLEFAKWEKRLAAAWKGGDRPKIRAVQDEYRAYVREHAFENAIAVHPGWFGNTVESPNMK